MTETIDPHIENDKPNGFEEEILSEADDRRNVADETELEDHGSKPFTISSYGADYTVDSLVKRVEEASFFVPPFQRSLVWNIKQASRFIESLLMGLPVPGVFVFRESQTNRHLIVDGQQRLRTLHGFYKGVFRGQEFQLQDVSDQWLGQTYKTLDNADRLRLDDSVIHTTIFRQEEPKDNINSIYEVFERINSGGIKLSDQEIRVCVNFGKFTALLSKLNELDKWRTLYGKKSIRLKDQELILRFLALLFDSAAYQRPMRAFLNSFMERHAMIKDGECDDFSRVFEGAVSFVHDTIGRRAFRPERALNTAVFDATLVGTATRLSSGPIRDREQYIYAYDRLLVSEEFIDAYTRSTANEEKVQLRIKLAKNAFLALS